VIGGNPHDADLSGKISAVLAVGRASSRLLAVVAFVAALSAADDARAQAEASPAPATTLEARGQRISVIPFDALGMDEERVIKLESLFRNELERLSGRPGPTRRLVLETVRSKRFRRCAGESACLAEIGKHLETDLVVAGNVAALGDSYVVNIKAIRVADGQEINRTASDPLRGNPDELIEAVRIAAYRLLAPKELLGSITLLADVDGATVILDGKIAGTTPLAGPIPRLSLGTHKLSVTREGFSSFARDVEVRFQKTTKVVVRLATSAGGTQVPAGALAGGSVGSADHPWYTSTWFIVGVGVVAITAGALVGHSLGKTDVIDCSGGNSACAP